MATAKIRLDVNKSVFSWAIARAGCSESDAVKSYPKFLQWKTGEAYATPRQLKDFSNKFHFPFGYFFLNELPAQPDIIPFFRSFEESTAMEDFNIRELIKLLQERQEWVADYIKTNGVEPNEAVGLFKNENNPLNIKNGILKFLKLSDGWQLTFNKPEQAIKNIITILEDNNIFVTFNSVVSFDTHRPIPVKLCRGFCLVNDYAPFIFVNSGDSKKAQLFTLIHELAHIFISFSSGFGDFETNEIDDLKEKLCDKIAAEFLVPENLFLEYAEKKTTEELSALFKVSEIVILRRKLDLGLISKDSFFRQYNQLPKIIKQTSGGGDFYLSAHKRIGGKFLRFLNNAMMERQLTPMEAYHLAGVKGDTFARLTAGVMS